MLPSALSPYFTKAMRSIKMYTHTFPQLSRTATLIGFELALWSHEQLLSLETGIQDVLTGLTKCHQH